MALQGGAIGEYAEETFAAERVLGTGRGVYRQRMVVGCETARVE